MSSMNPAVSPHPFKNRVFSVLSNRWFFLGVSVLIVSIILMVTLDMQLYAVSMAAGLMGIALRPISSSALRFARLSPKAWQPPQRISGMVQKPT